MPKALYRVLHRARILTFHARNVLRLDGRERLSYVGSRAARVVARLGSRARTAERSGPSAEASFRAALAHYSPAPYEGPLLLFRATELPLGIEHAPDMGWGALASEVEVVTVPGYFTTPISEPGVKLLAERLSGRLAGLAPAP
jgi:thioesterase domain-containing protein